MPNSATAAANLRSGAATRTGKWSLTGDLNIGRNGFHATRLNDARVLVVGSVEPMAPGYVRQCDLYDPVRGTWSLTGTLNQSHAYFEQVLLADRRVLIAGGLAGQTNPSRIVEIFDPTAGTWAASHPLTTPQAIFAANLLNNGILSRGRTVMAMEITPSPASKNSTPRQYHTATILLDGQVLIAGEAASKYYNLSQTQRFTAPN